MQTAGKTDEARLKNVAFENSVGVTTLSPADFEFLLGLHWRTDRFQKLDFSGVRFQLETLAGLELLERARLRGVQFIDISDNRLHNLEYLNSANGFEFLKILIAQRNMFTCASLQLTNLVELNLGYNMIKVPPDLTFVPLLEVLILTHNQLSGSFQAFSNGSRLKTLDLSNNNYDCCPSELARALDFLAQVKSLTNLRLYANPFIACFSEYQVFVVRRLAGLIYFDDLKISRSLRNSIQDTALLPLEIYDDQFRKRKIVNNEEQRKKNEKQISSTREGEARMSVLIRSLEEIFDDPCVLQKNVDIVWGQAFVFTQSMRQASARKEPGGRGKVEEIFWAEVHAPEKNFEILSSRTVELIVSIMERHESVRQPLIEALGYLTAVCMHSFGAKCMAAIGKIMLGSELSRNQAAETLSSIVMTNVKTLCEEDMSSVYCKSLIGGLNIMLLQNQGIKDFIALGMKDLLGILAKRMEDEPLIVEFPHIVKLLANLTETEENSKEVARDALANRCIAALDNKSISEAQSLRDLYIDVLNLSENIVSHGQEHILDLFVNSSTHVQTISRARAIAQGTRVNDPLEATTLANIFNFVAALMKRQPSVLHDCCESFHILELLCKILMQRLIDPLVLGSACSCLTMILRDAGTYMKHAGTVVEDLQMLVPLLDFLDGKRFRDLYKQALRHGADAKLRSDIDHDNIEVPPLTHLSNEKVCFAFLGVIKLLTLFCETGENGETDEHRQQVQQFLSNNGSEAVLLSMLLMANDDIKLEVMSCIATMPVNQIEPKEMAMLIKSISETRNLGEGRAEKVLAKLVQVLGRLVDDKGSTGDEFRRTYAQIAVAEVYQTLCRNARRDTHGHETEENEKLVLSQSAVSFLRCCGQLDDLRPQMRKIEINMEFPELLKLEEELHSRCVGDVAIEQTWTGRSMDNLMRCLTGPRMLDINKKVILRVLSRIADILEGQTDQFRETERSLQEIANTESHMWGDKYDIERRLRYLDPVERDDRIEQSTLFMKNWHGINVILELLSTNSIRERARDIANHTEHITQAIVELQNHEVARLRDEVLQPSAGDHIRKHPSDDEDDPDQHINGHTALANAILQYEELSDEIPKPLFSKKPKAFVEDPELFKEGSETDISFAYTLAAFFRILHALVIVPASDKVRELALVELRHSATLVRLIAMAQEVPCLCCAVAAKLIRVMHYVMFSVTHTVVDDKTAMIQNLKLVTTYVDELAQNMCTLLQLSSERRLEMPEQNLGLEMARFMCTAVAAVPFVHPASTDIVQLSSEAIEKCVEWLIQPVCVKLFIGFVIYEIQIDMGGGSRGNIHRDYVKRAYSRLGLKEHSTEMLVQLLSHCEAFRYEVLERFNEAEVFDVQGIRPCYIMELMHNANLGRYKVSVEKYLHERCGKHHGFLPVCWFELVYMPQPWTNTFALNILCATSETLYMFAPPSDRPPRSGSTIFNDFGRWDPSWELEHPRHPVIVWERNLSTLHCIYRCYGPQLLALEWEACESTGAAALPVSPLAFFQIGVRDHFADFLHHTSAPSEANRAPVVTDPRIRAEVSEAVGSGVLAVSISTAPPLSKMGAVFKQQQVDAVPRLFVLTEQEVFDFTLDLSCWTAPDPESLVVEDKFNESIPVGLLDEEEMAEAVLDKPPDKWKNAAATGKVDISKPKIPENSQESEVDISNPVNSQTGPKKKQRFCGFRNFKKTSVPDRQRGILTKIASYPMPPKEVTFEMGCQPDLSIKSADGVDFSIRFFDDPGREHWRKALAYIVAKGTGSWERVS